MEYRVENKYIVSETQIAYLKAELENVMAYDSNMTGNSYLIRSVYFDDVKDSNLFDNESGVDEREKFRIRTYNNDSTLIHLEQKGKTHGYTSKRSEAITYEDCRMYLQGFIPVPSKKDGFLKKKFYALTNINQLRPKCIVEYERTAFTEYAGNVRITFDRNISGTSDTATFFDEILPAVPTFLTGQHILEVKYDELLPDYIKRILNSVSLQRTAYSKYYYVRKNQNIE